MNEVPVNSGASSLSHICDSSRNTPSQHTGLKSGHQDPPLPDTDSPEAPSSNIPSDIGLELGWKTSVIGAQAGDLAGDDGLHDL
jgi:hypothetical protein